MNSKKTFEIFSLTSLALVKMKIIHLNDFLHLLSKYKDSKSFFFIHLLFQNEFFLIHDTLEAMKSTYPDWVYSCITEATLCTSWAVGMGSW